MFGEDTLKFMLFNILQMTIQLLFGYIGNGKRIYRFLHHSVIYKKITAIYDFKSVNKIILQEY